MSLKKVTFNSYSGYRCSGTVPLGDCLSDSIMDLASWLTAQVESGGMFGTIISYDGTGVTAGIHQAVAVFPKTLTQGPLWELLDKCRTVCPDGFDELRKVALDPFGWELKNGKLTRNGTIVTGKEIRKIYSGSENGVLPNSLAIQKTCEGIILAFHEFFINPLTFPVQLAFGEKEFEVQLKKKLRFSKNYVEQSLYDIFPQIRTYDKKDELSLALSLYLSHSVNAPGQALVEMGRIIDRLKWDSQNPMHMEYFAKQTVYVLGNSSYGRWNYTISNGRYGRSRTFAMKLWPQEYFDGPNVIFPKNIKNIDLKLKEFVVPVEEPEDNIIDEPTENIEEEPIDNSADEPAEPIEEVKEEQTIVPIGGVTEKPFGLMDILIKLYLMLMDLFTKKEKK